MLKLMKNCRSDLYNKKAPIKESGQIFRYSNAKIRTYKKSFLRAVTHCLTL